eukprot:3377058-Prymnesium_polylepis.1
MWPEGSQPSGISSLLLRTAPMRPRYHMSVGTKAAAAAGLDATSGTHITSGPPYPARLDSHLGESSATTPAPTHASGCCGAQPSTPFSRRQAALEWRRSYAVYPHALSHTPHASTRALQAKSERVRMLLCSFCQSSCA